VRIRKIRLRSAENLPAYSSIEPFHVGELHPEAVRPGVGRSAVHLREAVGRDLLELLLACALLVAVNRRTAHWGGRAWVMSRIRASSVVPGAAVNPKRARVETTRPSVAAAFCRAVARICGCQRFLTSPAPGGRAGRGGAA
jgi:hypothetical protein